MVMYLLDVASYQGALLPADVKRAEFAAVNLKVSHGLSRQSVHPNITGWVEQSRELGLSISTFHWLTADAGGAEQAEYAYARIAELGLEHGTAHSLDVESAPAPTLAQVRAYLERMTALLGRPVAVYTGDWWWTARGWDVHDLTPYLWSAPNAGYLGSYPGDTSPHWVAGYGGWTNLAVMQYAVAPLRFPDGTSGTIKVSKSAIRDPSVWRDLTTGRPGMSYAPDTLRRPRRVYIDCIELAGGTIDPLSVGIVGDDSHANSGTSYHLGKDALKSTAYSIVESARDRRGLTDAASGIDLGKFSITVKGRVHNLRTFSAWLVGECEAGAPDTLDIREVIYSPDGKVVKRWDRLKIRTTGDSSHLSHTHVSRFRDAENSDSLERLIRRYFTEIGVLESDDMTPAEMTAWAKSAEGKAALQAAMLTADLTLGEGNPRSLRGGILDTANRIQDIYLNRWHVLAGQVAEIRAAQAAMQTAVLQAIAAGQVDPAEFAKAVAAAVVDQLPPGGTGAPSVQQLADALRLVLLGATEPTRPALTVEAAWGDPTGVRGDDDTGGTMEGRQEDPTE